MMVKTSMLSSESYYNSTAHATEIQNTADTKKVGIADDGMSAGLKVHFRMKQELLLSLLNLLQLRCIVVSTTLH